MCAIKSPATTNAHRVPRGCLRHSKVRFILVTPIHCGVLSRSDVFHSKPSIPFVIQITETASIRIALACGSSLSENTHWKGGCGTCPGTSCFSLLRASVSDAPLSQSGSVIFGGSSDAGGAGSEAAARMQQEAKALQDAWNGGAKFSDEDAFAPREGVPAC